MSSILIGSTNFKQAKTEGSPLRWISIVLVLVSGSALRSDDFPLKRVPALTYVVDYEPFWSPDGRRIVLISTRHGGMKVHVMDATTGDGSSMRQLTAGDAEDDSPAWSPDGRKIAFVSIRGGASKIFVMNVDGTGVRQVTTGSGQDIHPMCPRTAHGFCSTRRITARISNHRRRAPAFAG